MKSESPSEAEHTSRLVVETALVGDIHANVLHPNDIERTVRKGQVECIAEVKRDGLAQPNSLVEHPPGFDEGLGYVDAGHATVMLYGQRPRRTTDTAAGMKDPISLPKTGEHREVVCGGAPAYVEVLEWREVAWHEAVDVFSGCGQRLQEHVAELRSAVVGGP